MKKYHSFSLRFALLLLAAFPLISKAQDSSPEMADVMRSNGKIYVVVGVLSVILAGLLIFLMNIDKRVRKIEKEQKSG